MVSNDVDEPSQFSAVGSIHQLEGDVPRALYARSELSIEGHYHVHHSTDLTVSALMSNVALLPIDSVL